MPSFAVYKSGRLADSVNLAGAYLFGSDDIPLRADIGFKSGIVTCEKRAAGPAGLALLWEVAGVGSILLETVRLQEREKPYILQIELVRGRMMRITQRLEDWGLIDYEGIEEIDAKISEASDLLILALQADTPVEAAAYAEQALTAAVKASESLAEFHAELFLSRRVQSAGFTRQVFGCAVNLGAHTENIHLTLSKAFDFVTLPLSWRELEPTEQTFNWRPLDAWVESLSKHRVPMKGSALLSFNERSVPDWLYAWEHDFDTVRDLAFEHVRRVINRYGQYIQMWDVVSGLHATNCFTFNFEQLIELTRLAASLTKQIAPRSSAIIDIVAPWGEYYARNQRTIPPLLYADMVIQSGVNFDAFGLQFRFGADVDGMFVRDMFQISCLLDNFVKLGKPLHVTAVQVPSAVAGAAKRSGGTTAAPGQGGSWHGSWNEKTQSEWLGRFLEIALSKPYVESVSWRDLTDHPEQFIPHAGLLRSDLAPKPAYEELVRLRTELRSGKRQGESPAG